LRTVDHRPLRARSVLRDAGDHGRHDVVAAALDAGGGRPHTADDDALHAGDLHGVVSQVPVRVGAQLDVFELGGHRAAVVHPSQSEETMASTKTYAGPTKAAALQEAARDVGLDVSEIEIVEIVVRRDP